MAVFHPLREAGARDGVLSPINAKGWAVIVEVSPTRQWNTSQIPLTNVGFTEVFPGEKSN
jgi:hypothetical protein